MSKKTITKEVMQRLSTTVNRRTESIFYFILIVAPFFKKDGHVHYITSDARRTRFVKALRHRKIRFMTNDTSAELVIHNPKYDFTQTLRLIQQRIGSNNGFILLNYLKTDCSKSNYASNIDRKDVKKIISETLTNLKNGKI